MAYRRNTNAKLVYLYFDFVIISKIRYYGHANDLNFIDINNLADINII